MRFRTESRRAPGRRGWKRRRRWRCNLMSARSRGATMSAMIVWASGIRPPPAPACWPRERRESERTEKARGDRSDHEGRDRQQHDAAAAENVGKLAAESSVTATAAEQIGGHHPRQLRDIAEIVADARRWRSRRSSGPSAPSSMASISRRDRQYVLGTRNAEPARDRSSGPM